MGASAKQTRSYATMPFVAPEVLSPEGYWPCAADIWSCGVILLECLCGLDCMKTMMGWSSLATLKLEQAEQLQKFFAEPGNLQTSVNLCRQDPLPDDVIEVLYCLLVVEPENRWTAEDAVGSTWLAASTAI